MHSKLFLFLMFFVPVFVNAQVTQEWVQRYDGPANYIDEAYCIVVDDSGNVYVTGESGGIGTSSDYATIKYNSSGIEQWVARYNGPPGNGLDRANSIDVDAFGNVYVTGYSSGNGTGSDYATVKYNSSGVQQWEQRYNGPGNQADEANSIIVDDFGNVFVTGSSSGSVTSFDYATIKYNSSGDQQWVQRYHGPGNNADRSISISIDVFGNVYVTGLSYGGVTGYDCATVKYNSSGVQQWVQRYNGPENNSDNGLYIDVDTLQNVYVTGGSIGSGIRWDYITIKYNSSGIQQWAQRYNGPGNYDDLPNSMTVDNSGNVYVTGLSIGNGTGSDYATIKYNSDGIQQWIQRYDSEANSDEANSVDVDASGNVYVTGKSFLSHFDCVTIKYNSTGAQLWIQRYTGPGFNEDGANSIIVDAFENVYVTGSSWGNGDDYVTIKYSQNVGIQQISTEFPGNFILEQNYPNPFNPTTNIKFDIPENSFVKIVIYNSLGKEIMTLVNEELNAGSYQADWDAGEYPSGAYFYRIEAENFVQTKSMVLLK